MTSQEFVLWFKGFTEGVHEYNITPKQWDYLKEKLSEVNDEQSVGEGGLGTPNTYPFPTWQHPHYTDPYNPYKITCSSGSFGTITTPETGYVTIANPYIASFGSGAMSTSTAYNYSSGSAWSYTNGGNGLKD